MTALFLVILIVVVIVLWIKVSDLSKRIEHMNEEFNYHIFDSKQPSQEINKQQPIQEVKQAKPADVVTPLFSQEQIDKKASTTPLFTQKAQDESNFQPIEPKKRDKKSDVRTFESWFGRNVVGIAASILIFVGLIVLGTLVYDYLSETAKIIAMYAISSIILILGLLLSSKKRNEFTIILVGCGFGSFFISIMLTHLYFDKMNDITAFSFLLVWMAIALFTSKKISSTLLSIVAHVGMIFSICFAYGGGVSDENLLLLLIYQAASIAVILIGNILCCKKTYNFGIFVSLFLTIVASMFMMIEFVPDVGQNFQTTLSEVAIVFAFIAQFLCASFLSYLLSVSTNKLKGSSYGELIHLANKGFWIVALFINIYRITYKLALSISIDSFFNFHENLYLNATFISILVCLAIICVHFIITLYLQLKLNFDENLGFISLMILSILSCIFILIPWSRSFYEGTILPQIPYLFIFAGVMFLINRLTKNHKYTFIANIILCLDAVIMIMDGYHSLNDTGTIALSIFAMLFYLSIIFVQVQKLSDELKQKYLEYIKIIAFLFTEASIISIFYFSNFKYDTEVTLFILTILNIFLYIIQFDKSKSSSNIFSILLKTNESILIFSSALLISFGENSTTESILHLLLAVLTLVYSFTRINEVLDGSNKGFQSVLAGIKFTVIILAVVQGQTSWFDHSYIFSIFCMLTALINIALGFVGKAKYLRLYGLILTMFCVLKLVTYDAAELNTWLRVFALISGGIICFAISAIYNYTSKKLNK